MCLELSIMSQSQGEGTNGLEGAAEKEALRLRDIIVKYNQVLSLRRA